MNRDLADTGGGLLAIPQFTLLGDTSQRRPFFGGALAPVRAAELFTRFVATARTLIPDVAAGVFGAHMRVASINDGPVTLIY
jgi:D-aminoacyl-tRNA deacylase